MIIKVLKDIYNDLGAWQLVHGYPVAVGVQDLPSKIGTDEYYTVTSGITQVVWFEQPDNAVDQWKVIGIPTGMPWEKPSGAEHFGTTQEESGFVLHYYRLKVGSSRS